MVLVSTAMVEVSKPCNGPLLVSRYPSYPLFVFFPSHSSRCSVFLESNILFFLLFDVDLCTYRFGSSPETPFQETSQVATPIPIAGALLLPTSLLVYITNKKKEKEEGNANLLSLYLLFHINRKHLSELILPESTNRP